MPTHVPKTTKEALNMVKRGWMFLLKKNPTIFAPLTFWMVFGGFIFLYNYVSADKFSIKEAKPIGAVETRSYGIIDRAIAAQKPSGVPIIFNNQLWGYEDTTFIAKVDANRPILLVFDKTTKRVYQVEFTGAGPKMQLQQKRF